MTSIKKLAVAIGIITSLLSLSVYAQSPRPGLNHFSTDGISFDYPNGYSVTDESTAEAQQFVITRKGSSVQLTIVAMRRMIQQNELQAAIENFKEPIIKKIGITFGQANSAGRIPIQSQVGPKQAEGVRLQSVGNRKRTADVIWLRWNFRVVALTFVRSAVNEAVESRLWQTVRSSLRVEAPVVIGTKTDGVGPTEDTIAGGVLNGKALALPKPDYPAIARAAHASGTVVVQVLIDEEGNVVAAHVVKFSPTLLEGEPVKVTGVIQYNFVAQ